MVDDTGAVMDEAAAAAARGGERCCCCCEVDATPVGPVERERWARYWLGGERGEWICGV